MAENEVVETTTEETPEVKTPTVEDQLAQMKAQLEEVTRKKDEYEKGLRTAHQTLTQKDKEIKSMSDFHSRMDEFEERIKILAAAQVSGVRVSEDNLDDIPQGKKQDLLATYEKLETEQKAKRETAKKQVEAESYKQQADAVYTKAKEVFGDDEEAIEKIEDYLVMGRLDRAERRIARAEKAKTPIPKNEETDRAKLEKEIEERVLREHGLLKTDSLTPSGRTKNRDEVLDRYIRGEGSLEDASKALG